jgi:hypothetical protein
MTSIALCMAAALLSFVAARRSLVTGLLTVLGIGYAYGVTRANLPETFSHFIFDAAVIGLYSAQLSHLLGPARNPEFRPLKLWVGALVVWPMLLCLIPLQDPLIQLVGLRGNVFFLPFLLIGARLGGEELRRLALGIAILNVLAFLMAVSEFFVGVSPFFPENAVTQLIYASKDIANYTAYRIPSFFTSAHAYAGTMVMTIPLLLGAFVQEHDRFWKRCCILVGLFVSILGVFLSGTRSHFIVLMVAVVVSAFSGHQKLGIRLAWLAALLGIALIVSGEERLQRFAELSDTDSVGQRFTGSVNRSFLELAGEHPLGIGLGAGTSVPYFLQDRVPDSTRIENEYGRILLELGIPGLCLWAGFIIWVFTRRLANRRDPRGFGRRVGWFTAAAYFASGLIGVGLLTSIPQTCLLLLTTGWIAAPLQEEAISRLAPEGQVQLENSLPAWQWGPSV